MDGFGSSAFIRVIRGATFRSPAAPPDRLPALLFCHSPGKAIHPLGELRGQLSDILDEVGHTVRAQDQRLGQWHPSLALDQDFVPKPALRKQHHIDRTPYTFAEQTRQLINGTLRRFGFERQIDIRGLVEPPGLSQGPKYDHRNPRQQFPQRRPQSIARFESQSLTFRAPFKLDPFQQRCHACSVARGWAVGKFAAEILAIMPVDVDCNIQVLLGGSRVFGSNSKLEKSCVQDSGNDSSSGHGDRRRQKVDRTIHRRRPVAPLGRLGLGWFIRVHPRNPRCDGATAVPLPPGEGARKGG